MSLHLHHLTGCTPTPLAGYLKALGVLRLIASQADAEARGCWRDEHFVLGTRLGEEELADFFLKQYAPTPFVAPWNKGGGFFSKADFLERMESSPLPRLKPYQEGIRAARELCLDMERAAAEVWKIKDEPKTLPKAEKEALRNSQDYKARLAQAERVYRRYKGDFLPECRLRWRGPHLEWLDAAMILRPGDKPVYPALFGSGGNDGRLDFTKIFMEMFQELFDVSSTEAPVSELTRALLRHALLGTPELGTGEYIIGMYHPGAAGGANSTCGLVGRRNVNPWDFLLVMEGAMLFSAAGSRRLASGTGASVSAPFTVHGAPAGHTTASATEKLARGEQWMPLWNRPVRLDELRSLLGEGRAQVGRTPTRQPVDLARAVARLGVSRGVDSFERYAFLERNGQANFAVPLGRWKVVTQPNQELLADLDAWLGRFQRAARDKVAPARLGLLGRRLTDAVLGVTTRGAEPLRWQDLLLALADADAALAVGTGISAGALSGLRPGWLAAADDGSPELRLALALAAVHGVRHHFLPLDRFGRLSTSDEGKRLASDPRVVCAGRDFLTDACALVRRRLVESAGNHDGQLDMTPIHAAVTADLRDLSLLLRGVLDGGRILRLARSLMMLDPVALKERPRQLRPPEGQGLPVDDAFAMLRFCLLPRHLVTDDEWRIPVREAVFHRLSSGDFAEAIRQGAAHLRSHGRIPPISVASGDARLLAASMAFPISRSTRDQLQRQFISPTKEKGAMP